MGNVQRKALANTLKLTAVGIAIGTLIVVARAIASLLFATSPWDFPR